VSPADGNNRLGSRAGGYGCTAIDRPKEGTVLITILVILVIIVLALFIWRNMVGRRV
jgi:hypothetical protein